MLKYRFDCHTEISLQIMFPYVIKSVLEDICNATSNISAITCKICQLALRVYKHVIAPPLSRAISNVDIRWCKGIPTHFLCHSL